VRVIVVDEPVWRHTRRGDEGYVTVTASASQPRSQSYAPSAGRSRAAPPTSWLTSSGTHQQRPHRSDQRPTRTPARQAPRASAT
jgi:hypothetical protein